MSVINSSNAKEHSYPVYGRQFRSFRWYKPILVSVLFIFFYIILGAGLVFLVAAASRSGAQSLLGELTGSVLVESYDDMDLANTWQSILSLGSVAVMIPALWLAAKIVRDRPFSSYSSSRGGWSSKVFRKVFPIAFLCISAPIIVDSLFIEHRIDDFSMKFTIAGLLIVTVLGPLQCIAEEYVFRGLLMQTLGSWSGVPVVAVILQALVFVSMHPYDMVGRIEILISGMVFGLTAWLGRGIEISSAYHICNNMTVFYLQGMNMATISSESTVPDMVFSAVCGIVYVILIFIISKRKNWFNRIRRDDLAEWNEKYDEKIARKEAKAEAKAEKRAAKNGPAGAHDESAPGKHFKLK